MWAPRALQWNLASAAAIACLALIAIGGSVTQALRWREASVAAIHRVATVAATPPVVLVRLVVVQPGARVVQAAGDFNGWNPSNTPLEQTADGAWTVTLPLEPGRYDTSSSSTANNGLAIRSPPSRMTTGLDCATRCST